MYTKQEWSGPTRVMSLSLCMCLARRCSALPYVDNIRVIAAYTCDVTVSLYVFSSQMFGPAVCRQYKSGRGLHV